MYCGACWAFGATSSISDRIAIMRGNKFPEINISPQVLLTCDAGNDGCHGGDSQAAYQWMHDNDITEENCAPYRALSWKEGLVCNATAVCQECFDGKPCYVPPKYNKYRVGEYGLLPQNEEAIRNEIYARGPVSCSIFANPIVNWTGSGVFASNDPSSHNHVISVVGWGATDDGTPYWVVRNSWGEWWDDKGYIKIYRGNNTIQIESYCVYGVPINTWSNQTYPHQPKPEAPTPAEYRAMDFKPQPRQPKRKPCAIDHSKVLQPVVTAPLPQDTIADVSLPDGFFYGDVEGVNFLSWHVNQHLPQYCGSCWAQAGVASIADRIRLMTNNAFPKVALSAQVLINCYAEGSCGGGWGAGPYVFAHKHGIPEFGCQPYLAKDPDHFSCSDMQTCFNCRWNPDFSQHCWAVSDFKRWYVADHGSLRGASNMKKEIFARGPISCGISASTKFETTYTGGIYSEVTVSPFPNHYVSVVGWGKDPQAGEYWIARNSWGTHFGENGYFRIKMHRDNLGLDTYECFWGVPSETKPSTEATATS
jgi:cathepsin X